MGTDLEICIRDQAEMLTALVMKVEHYALTAYETGIIASSSPSQFGLRPISSILIINTI